MRTPFRESQLPTSYAAAAKRLGKRDTVRVCNATMLVRRRGIGRCPRAPGEYRRGSVGRGQPKVQRTVSPQDTALNFSVQKG